MRNAKDAVGDPNERIFMAGRTGCGKTAQIWTLPGRKIAYIFDPNSMRTLAGLDVDVVEMLPDRSEIDETLKGFNRDKSGNKFKGDKPKTAREPTLYERWNDDFNMRYDAGTFSNGEYKWLIFDSATFWVKAMMDRQLFINQKAGDIQDLADYRIVGNKLSDVLRPITTLPINIYMTGHISVFQDEKTKKIDTQLNLPGSARVNIPIMFTNVWKAYVEEDEKGNVRHMIRTIPEPRGLLDIRTSIRGLKPDEDVSITDWKNPEKQGIGKLLSRR